MDLIRQCIVAPPFRAPVGRNGLHPTIDARVLGTGALQPSAVARHLDRRHRHRHGHRNALSMWGHRHRLGPRAARTTPMAGPGRRRRHSIGHFRSHAGTRPLCLGGAVHPAPRLHRLQRYPRWQFPQRTLVPIPAHIAGHDGSPGECDALVGRLSPGAVSAGHLVAGVGPHRWFLGLSQRLHQ